MPRIIRDLSQDLNKEIDLKMIGAEIELDRQVIEVIKDPLMHMVRNSADHGLESSQERLDAGKSKKGHVLLKAYHAGGYVIIEISDDGRGLDKNCISEKIVKNGIETQEQVDLLTDKQIYNNIFAAGFSTAETVTNISGRGVGMDVVRTNIEKIGGSVEVHSIPDQGSIFTVKIPLTLAIVSALIIRSGGQRFAIPQVSIVELLQASADSGHTVEYINSHPVLRLRNQLLPLITLSKVLNINEEKKHSSSNKISENKFIVAAEVGSGQFGIIVDAVYDTEEIVVKPVSSLLRSVNIFAGNTILGDGSVVMILDPKSISDKVGDIHSVTEALTQDEKQTNSSNERLTRFLLFKSGDGAPKAVPFSLIVRLEDIKADDIEVSNGVHVLQYRDQLMPLTSIQGFLDYEPSTRKHVIVFQQNNEYIGLVVDEIIDIVEGKLDIKMNTNHGGSYGSLVIAEQTTDLIDIDYFIQQICPNWHSLLDIEGDCEAHKESYNDSTICFVDNCTLYRNLIIPLLELQNIKSLSFNDGHSVINYVEENSINPDAFIIDKDSLGDDPAAFFESYKTLFSNVPCFIIGSHFNADDEVFFTENDCIACLSKKDRDSIITTIRDYLEQARSLAS